MNPLLKMLAEFNDTMGVAVEFRPHRVVPGVTVVYVSYVDSVREAARFKKGDRISLETLRGELLKAVAKLP